MKFLISLLSFFTGVSVISSCQKEFTIETTTAKGSLQKDSSGDCMPSLPYGVYAKDSLLKASNYVDITVKITQTGSYSIKTDTVNGYSFSAAGDVGVIGLNTIRLQGKGRPMVGGVDVFKIKFDSSICEFDVIVTGASAPPAGYTINCTGATIVGNYEAGVPTTSANKATISATSANAGSYNISTDSMNGVSFSGSGSFPAATTQAVTLTATGTPVTTGIFSYTVTAATGGSTCTFSVTFTGVAPISTDSIVANIDGLYTTFKIRDSAKRNVNSGYNLIGILGYNNVAGDESFGFLIGTMAPLGPGTYTVNQFPAVVVAAQDTSATFAYYAQTDPTSPPQIPGFTVTITTLTATRVIGTFSGRLLENMGAGPGFRNITNGKFSVTIYP